MSIGNPKKFDNLDAIERDLKMSSNMPDKADTTRVYKRENSTIKKALNFKTKRNRSKLT